MSRRIAALFLVVALCATSATTSRSTAQTSRPAVLVLGIAYPSFTKLAALGFENQIKVDYEVDYRVRRANLLEYAGILVVDPRPAESIIGIADFVTRRGRRAFLLFNGLENRTTIEQYLGLSLAREFVQVQPSLFRCMPMWGAVNSVVANAQQIQTYLVPGPDFVDICSVRNPANGQTRVVAGRRQLGSGQLIASVMSASPGPLAFPLGDNDIDLFDNRLAAARTLLWLVER